MPKQKTICRRLFVALLLLFIMQVLLLPAVISATYATKSVKPEHIITYTPGKLSWDENTETDSSGAARLFLFDSAYENTSADNGEKTIAPGTQRESVIRLLNESSGKISYRAVLFYKKSDKALPASLTLSGEGFRDSENTALPKELRYMSVVRSVTGELAAKGLQELDVSWLWEFEDGEKTAERDESDTSFGNKAAEGNDETLSAGVYIVIEDENGTVLPDVPKTGDTSRLAAYIILMCCSASSLLVLFFAGRKRKDDR